jgi:hypothetical protein
MVVAHLAAEARDPPEMGEAFHPKKTNRGSILRDASQSGSAGLCHITSPVLEPPAMPGMLRKSAAFAPRY